MAQQLKWPKKPWARTQWMLREILASGRAEDRVTLRAPAVLGYSKDELDQTEFRGKRNLHMNLMSYHLHNCWAM